MTLTLPSPPLSPIDKPLGFDRPSSRPGHHRHPPRRHDTFELLQALVIEHQRLEKQDYETMMREVPAIQRRSSTPAPKGILVNSTLNDSPAPVTTPQQQPRQRQQGFLSKLSSLPKPSSSSPKRHSVVRFAPGPPKVYKYNKVPQEV